MINFFRSSSIIGTIILAILFLAIRLPAEWLNPAILPIEIKYLALAEKLAQGNWLYIDIWDNTAPLSALVYTCLFLLFGKTLWAYHLLAGVLVFIQAIQWNFWLVRTKMYQERNQIPAIVYLLLASLWTDCYTLSPELMANTFLIMVLGNTFLHLNEQHHTEKAFEIGVYLGVATLFHFPIVFVLFGIIIAFLLFSGTKLREYVLLHFGLTLPFLLLATAFYFKDGFYYFLDFFIWSSFKLPKSYTLSLLHYLVILAVPSILLLLSLVALPQSVGFVNYQVRCQQTMLIVLFFCLGSIFITSEIAIYASAVLWCSVSFFIAHLFLLFKKRLLRNLIFLFFVATSVGLNYMYVLRLVPKEVQKYLPYPATLDFPAFQGKKIWVLDKKWEYYRYNKVSSPYFHWDLSKKYLQKVNYYDIQAEIYERLFQDSPDIIVGHQATIEGIFKRLPTFAQRYTPKKGYWEKIK
ncbi:MAG: hypothetical protein OHK0045_20750 [Raineya sp.]